MLRTAVLSLLLALCGYATLLVFCLTGLSHSLALLCIPGVVVFACNGMLTVLTTLFMPATLIAGIFGMNFHAMPLLDDPEGFWIALGVMGGAATVMAAAFWRRNWLRTR